MADDKMIIIKRDQLYERVWQTPTTQLALEYRMSDSRLAKICKKLRVPKPPPGYWAKNEHGKKVRTPPLPSLGPGDQIEFEHYVDEYPKRPIINDPVVQELMDKVPTISVPQQLTNPDPLIRNANGWVDRKPYTYIETPNLPHLNLNVYLDSKGRALKLMDSLVKGVRNLGYDVRGEDASNRSQYFGILGQRIHFRLKEHAKQVDHVLTTEQMVDKKKGRLFFAHKFDYLPTGHLTFYLEPSCWVSSGYRKKWSDSARRPLEDQIRDIIMGAISLASASIQAEEARKRAEQEAAEQMKKRIEEERKQAAEEARLRELDSHVARWAKSKQLKAFIKEFKTRSGEGSYSKQVTEEVSNWVSWAHAYAERLDPIAAILTKLAGTSRQDK